MEVGEKVGGGGESVPWPLELGMGGGGHGIHMELQEVKYKAPTVNLKPAHVGLQRT